MVNRSYREVFKPAEDPPADPGRVFYTLTAEDVGKAVIKTTAGVISIVDVIGRVLKQDVGKRLYRVPMEDSSGYIWQAESDLQKTARIAREP